MTKHWTLSGVHELPPIVAEIIPYLLDARVCLLRGEMGAGKTTFTKELCAQLGVEEVVSSPTFALVNTYALPNGSSIYHFDLHRLKSLQEALDIGFEEYLDSGYLCLIEWPDIILSLLEPPYWELTISHEPDGARLYTIAKHG
jgi:tRNA threonylcarbamoyladenosine biosynthesis protein TsaE